MLDYSQDADSLLTGFDAVGYIFHRVLRKRRLYLDKGAGLSETIKKKVTEQGVLIPLAFLEGVDEVEIRREDNVIVVSPVA